MFLTTKLSEFVEYLVGIESGYAITERVFGPCKLAPVNIRCSNDIIFDTEGAVISTKCKLHVFHNEFANTDCNFLVEKKYARSNIRLLVGFHCARERTCEKRFA